MVDIEIFSVTFFRLINTSRDRYFDYHVVKEICKDLEIWKARPWPIISISTQVGWLVGCLTSQQHASPPQERICSNLRAATLRQKLLNNISLN